MKSAPLTPPRIAALLVVLAASHARQGWAFSTSFAAQPLTNTAFSRPHDNCRRVAMAADTGTGITSLHSSQPPAVPQYASRIRPAALVLRTVGEVTTMEKMTSTTNEKSELLKIMYGAGENDKEIVSSYDKISDQYHDRHADGSWKGPNKVAEVASSLVSCPKAKGTVEILDFGAGTGLSGMAMKEKGFKTIDALDVSKGMVDVAQAKSNGELYRDVTIGFLKDDKNLIQCESYDMVVSTGCIGTHTDADELYRIMPLVKHGGYILYSIKSEANERESFQKLYSSLSEDEGGSADDEQKESICDEWTVAHSENVGPLNVDHPSVRHRIVALQRCK